MKSRNLVILGAGGFAREVAWLVHEINEAYPRTWNVIGYWDSDTSRVGNEINGLPIIGSAEVQRYLPDLFAVAAIGSPSVRERAVRDAEQLGCQFPALVHPTVRFDLNTITIGNGSIVCAGTIMTVNITIGRHVILNLHCTIGHDTVIEDFATLSPGCHLSGYTRVGRGAYMGTGSVTVESRTVGEGSVVGAGAVVARDIPSGVTAVGVPAKVKGE